MPEVQVVVAHRARATLRVGDVFLKVDLGRAGIDAEVAAIGDLQPDHVFVSEDQVTGIIDWSSAGAGTHRTTSPSSPWDTRNTWTTFWPDTGTITESRSSIRASSNSSRTKLGHSTPSERSSASLRGEIAVI